MPPSEERWLAPPELSWGLLHPISTEIPDSRLAILRVSGELDLLTAPIVGEHIEDQLRQGRHVIVDLSGTTFFGATATATLLRAHRMATDCKVRLHLAGAGAEHIALTVRATGLDKIIPVSRRPAAALAAHLLRRRPT